MIYFVQDGDSGPIKIGFSVNVDRRVKAMQTSHPRPLNLLLTVDGNKKYEKTLHERFWLSRLRGEWFEPSDDLLQFIDAQLQEEKAALNTATAYCHLEEGGENYLWVIDRCPHCGAKHTHGGGPLGDDPRNHMGHRVAHCVNYRGRGYILVERGLT